MAPNDTSNKVKDVQGGLDEELTHTSLLQGIAKQNISKQNKHRRCDNLIFT